MGSELATTADPPMLRVLRFRVETPNDLWIPPDDINSSWPRLHSPKANEREASLDVIVIVNLHLIVPGGDANQGFIMVLKARVNTWLGILPLTWERYRHKPVVFHHTMLISRSAGPGHIVCVYVFLRCSVKTS